MNEAADPYNQAEDADFQDPRWMRLRPSRLALTLLAAGVLLAVTAAVWSEPQRIISATWLTVISLAVLGLLAAEAHRQLQRDRSAVLAFHLIPLDAPQQGESDPPRLGIRLLRRDGKTIDEGVVVSGAYVTPLMTAIPYRLPGDPRWRRPRVLALWADSLDPEAFRQVRVQLKWR